MARGRPAAAKPFESQLWVFSLIHKRSMFLWQSLQTVSIHISGERPRPLRCGATSKVIFMKKSKELPGRSEIREGGFKASCPHQPGGLRGVARTFSKGSN